MEFRWRKGSGTLCPIYNDWRVTKYLECGNPHHLGCMQKSPKPYKFYFSVGAKSRPQSKLEGMWLIQVHAETNSSNIFCRCPIKKSTRIDKIGARTQGSWFLELSFCHIYREYNQLVDRLSKTSLSLTPGSGSYSEFFDGILASHENFKLIWASTGAFSPYFTCTLSFFVWSSLL